MDEDLKSKKIECKWWLPGAKCKPAEFDINAWKKSLTIDSNSSYPIKKVTSSYETKTFAALYTPIAFILCISFLVILFSRHLMKQRELNMKTKSEQVADALETVKNPPHVNGEKTAISGSDKNQTEYSTFTIGGIVLTVLVMFFGLSSRTFIKKMGVDPAMAPLVYGVILLFAVASFFAIKYLLNSQFFKDYLSSLIMRLWVAASASWLLVLCCYVLFFDPFGYRIDSREQAFLIKLIFAPPSLLFLIGVIFNVALNKKTN